VLAPPDLERIFGLVGGSIFQGEQGLDQMAFMRPSPRRHTGGEGSRRVERVFRSLPSRARVTSTRDTLLDATRRVISRAGFAGTTVEGITREAGASLGLLHYHFDSKDEVVAEAFAQAAHEDLAALQAISLRHEDPADRLAAYLDQSEWQDTESWRLWVDAWGESVHTPLVRDTLGRFDVGWRAVLAEVIADGVRRGRWTCADPQDTAARLVAVLDGIGLHTTVHGEDVPPQRATAWARRLAELELAG
jgi:AcrR family transcriptional regulator